MKRMGYEVDLGEMTPAEKRRRRRRLFMALAIALAIPPGVWWLAGDDMLAMAADGNACNDAAKHHLEQAEALNSTFHAQLAQAYAFQDIAGGDCTWPPEAPRG